MIRNVKVEVSGVRKAGVTTVADVIEDTLNTLGLTVVRNGDSIVVSGAIARSAEAEHTVQETPIEPVSALQQAATIVHGDREKTYGDAGKNLRTIAAYWSTHLKAAKSIDIPLTESDVCGMMILLKQARLASNPQHRDSLVDIAGYVELNDVVQQSKVKP